MSTLRVDETLQAAALPFLMRFPPFDGMETDALAFLVSRLALGYYAADTVILTPDHGPPAYLFIVRSGMVRLTQPVATGDAGFAPATLGPGECFSVGALLERRATGSIYTAAADTFCYQLETKAFFELLERSARFRQFSTEYVASLLRESRRLLHMREAGATDDAQTMSRPLRSLLRREPVTCPPQAPVGDALRRMKDAGTGSIVVTSPDAVPVGIFTRHDVLDRVALAECGLATRIEAVMTPAPLTLSHDATVHQAAMLIANRGIRHIPVVESGRLIGVVTERDLFSLQRVNLRTIQQSIAAAGTIEALRAAAHDIRGLAARMVAQCVGAEHVTGLVSALNDALTGRLLELESQRHDLDGIGWAWLAFGSEGRCEQTISSDQDNGLIFSDVPGESPGRTRDRLLPFAKAVNAALDACGYPLCKGDIMAGNPEWCLSLAEWSQQFESWIADTDPAALLGAAIFFDFRLLHGREALAVTLRDRLNALVARTPRFLRQLAGEAVATRPPLGLVTDFVTEDVPDAQGSIDLKKSAARIFIDAARILGLAGGVAHAGTVQRLREGGLKAGMGNDEISAAVEAFFFVQMLRLRCQIAGPGTRECAGGNRVIPERLNEVDRRMLKECLRQARRLQSRLRLDYQL